MPIQPKTLRCGERLRWYSLPVRVTEFVRAWSGDRVIGGTVWVSGRPRSDQPLDLMEFCAAAKRPRKARR